MALPKIGPQKHAGSISGHQSVTGGNITFRNQVITTLFQEQENCCKNAVKTSKERESDHSGTETWRRENVAQKSRMAYN
jgi:hypothetical protein